MSILAANAVCGVILAGGLARRMGGGDKALTRIGGQPILDRVRAVLAPCQGVMLNANGDPGRFAEVGLPVCADSLPGALGPLAGLLTGLEWAAEVHPECTHVLTVPGDAPFLPADLLPRLMAALAEGALIAGAMSDGRRHPVVALWPVSLRATLRHAVAEEGARAIGKWMSGFDTAWVEWPVEPVDPFFNVNSPEDAAAAEALAAGGPV